LKEVDKDGDGIIGFNEFCELMTKIQWLKNLFNFFTYLSESFSFSVYFSNTIWVDDSINIFYVYFFVNNLYLFYIYFYFPNQN
jgi:hypothetical protein